MADGIAVRFDAASPTDTDPNVLYTAAEERMLAQVPLMADAETRARPGIRPGAGASVTTGGTPEQVTIQPFSAVITDTAGGGSYVVVVPAAVSKNISTRPASGTSRIDELVAVIRNVDERPADGVKSVDIVLVAGTAGASPAAPSVASGALRLRRLTVPSSGAISLSNFVQRTVAAGGILPVESQSQRDAITQTYPGLTVWREDQAQLQTSRGGSNWGAGFGGDTGWIDVPLQSGFSAADGVTCQVRRFNGLVFWHGRIVRSGGFVANTNYLFAASADMPSWAIGGDDSWKTLPGDTPRGAVADALVQSDGLRVNVGSSTTTKISLSGLSGYPAA